MNGVDQTRTWGVDFRPRLHQVETVGRYGENREFALCESCGHPQMAHFGGACHCGCSRARSKRQTSLEHARVVAPSPKRVERRSESVSQQHSAPPRPERAARQVNTPQRADVVDELLARVRSAVFSTAAHDRAWDAVRIAARLRAAGDFGRALSLLDDVVAGFDHDDVASAAYACAVAIHCDQKDPVKAISVGRTGLAVRRSPALENALVRAYWERFEQTRADEDRRSWLAFRQSLEPRVAVAAS